MAQTSIAPRAPTRRFTVDEYYAMAEAGILGEDDRVELLDGEVVEMVPIGSRHAGTLKDLVQLLVPRLAGRATFGVQDPVRLGERSEPQPDFTILRPRPDAYRESHPGPEDVLLLIEVMQSSADYDRTVKVPLYAGAGIREVWLVDLEAEAIEMYRTPEGGAYREQATRRRGERVAASALPDVELAVDEVLGPKAG